MTTYAFGMPVRFKVAFAQQSDSAAVDPTDVIFRIQIYPGAVVEKKLSTGGVIKDATGQYHVDYTPISPGNGVYCWEGTGAVIATTQNTPITVTSNLFT